MSYKKEINRACSIIDRMANALNREAQRMRNITSSGTEDKVDENKLPEIGVIVSAESNYLRDGLPIVFVGTVIAHCLDGGPALVLQSEFDCAFVVSASNFSFMIIGE